MEIVQAEPVPPSPPMPPPALPPSPPSACVPTTVEIKTPRYWAYEMGYTIDGTITHQSSDLITSNRPMTNSNQFKNNKLFLHTICLGFGEHSIELFDSYGDGWDNGYLSVFDPAGGNSLLSPKTVTSYQAGPYSFMLAETQFSVLEEPITLQPKTTPRPP
uniref:Uncharacterized protein n=2 Tax=Chrysotila carterae TaxID=13221 RepID=A0A7S4F8S1_CHRCT